MKIQPSNACVSFLFVLIQIGNYFFFYLGPGFNLFLRELNFKIGPFVVDKYSSPGVSIECYRKLVPVLSCTIL